MVGVVKLQLPIFNLFDGVFFPTTLVLWLLKLQASKAGILIPCQTGLSFYLVFLLGERQGFSLVSHRVEREENLCPGEYIFKRIKLLSRAFYTLHIFPTCHTLHISPAPRLPHATYFPALAIRYIFSRARYTLHIFPRFHTLHIFPRLPHCFEIWLADYAFSRCCKTTLCNKFDSKQIWLQKGYYLQYL